VTDLADKRIGEWRADADWFDALDAGEISDIEFSRRVLDSLEVE